MGGIANCRPNGNAPLWPDEPGKTLALSDPVLAADRFLVQRMSLSLSLGCGAPSDDGNTIWA
jgi:hypothetical protein